MTRRKRASESVCTALAEDDVVSRSRALRALAQAGRAQAVMIREHSRAVRQEQRKRLANLALWRDA